MEILTVNDAIIRLTELEVTYLDPSWYSTNSGVENLPTNNELEKIFNFLKETYATDEFLDELSSDCNSFVWLVNFEKDSSTEKWQALFYDEDLKEIWINL